MKRSDAKVSVARVYSERNREDERDLSGAISDLCFCALLIIVVFAVCKEYARRAASVELARPAVERVVEVR